MEHVQGGMISPLVFLSVCLFVAGALGILTLVRYYHRPKCADCGVHLPNWSLKGGYSTLKVINPERARLVPLCRPCFTRRTTAPPKRLWVHKG